MGRSPSVAESAAESILVPARRAERPPARCGDAPRPMQGGDKARGAEAATNSTGLPAISPAPLERAEQRRFAGASPQSASPRPAAEPPPTATRAISESHLAPQPCCPSCPPQSLHSQTARSSPAPRSAPPATRSAKWCSTPRSPATRKSSPTRATARQIVTLTYPHVGNYGVSDEDVEASKVHAAGLSSRICRCALQLPRADVARRLPGARRHGRHRRHRHPPADAPAAHDGAQNGCIAAFAAGATRSRRRDVAEAVAQARAGADMAGLDLAKVVERARALRVDPDRVEARRRLRHAGDARFHVVAFDYGVKFNILRMLAERGCRVTVVPAQTPAADVLALKPDGVFLSNGPGDPEPCDYAIEATRELIERGMPDLRHLPGPPDHGAGLGREDLQDEVRPPRRQPPGQGPRQRPRQHHQPEPRLRGRPGDAAGQPAADARLAVRRHAAGPGAHRQAGVLLPGPPRSLPGPARHRLPVRPLHRLDDRGQDQEPSEPHAEAHRPQDRSSSSAPARSSSARPASSTTPAPRPARRCARRATGSSSSTPTRRRS